MFSQFTLKDGRDLIIRAIDLRSLMDTIYGCELQYEPTRGIIHDHLIAGTAQENMDRLKQEETEALIAAEKIRQRQSQGYPPDPIGRGKQAMRMVGK